MLRKTATTLNLAEQFATCAQLRNNLVIDLIFKNLVDLQNIRMREHIQVFNFIENHGFDFETYSHLFDKLYSAYVLGLLVNTLADFAIGTLTEHMLNLIHI